MSRNFRRFAALLVVLALCVGLFSVFSAVSAAESAELTYLAGGKAYSTQSCSVGDVITLPAYDGVVPEHYAFLGWTESTLTDTEQAPQYRLAGDPYTVSDPSQTLYALFSHGDLSGEAAYFLKTPAAISEADSVIVAMTVNSSTYALDNSCGAAAPKAVALNVSGDAVTGFVGDDIKWNLAKETDSLILYPEGTRSSWLLCSGNPRVGAISTYRAFEVKSNFLYATAKARYLGVDVTNGVWIGAGTNYDALAGQKLVFYVRTGGSPVFYTTDANTCAHDWQTVSVTAPTCTLSGYTSLQCSLCGETRKSDELAAIGHSYVVSTVEPTASEQGYDNHVCSICGDSFRDCYTDALGEGLTVRFSVPAGVTPITDMACDRLGIVLPALSGKPSDSSYSYVFKGWVTEAVDHSQTAPTILKAGSTYQATQSITLRALYQYATDGEIGTPTLTRILSGDTLASGEKLIIVSAGTTLGMLQQTSEKSSSHVASYNFYNDAQSVTDLQYLLVGETGVDGVYTLSNNEGSFLCNPTINTDLFFGDEVTEWTLLDLDNDTYMFYAGTHYLACRSDLSTSLANLWRTCSITATTPRELELYRYTSGQNGSSYYTTLFGSSEHTHTIEYVAEKAATCTAAGTAAYYCCTAADCPNGGLKYADEALQTELSDVHIPALGHDMQAGEIHEESCTTDGYTEYVCTRCGLVQDDATVPAHGHDFSVEPTANDDALYQAPACLQDGFIYYACSYCGQLADQPTVLPATGHTPTLDAAVAASCTVTGLTEGSHCSVCNAVLLAQTVVAASGHKYERSAHLAVSCTQAASVTYTCSVCDDSYTQEIPATGHQFTYTNNGDTHTATCSVCGEVVTEAHSFTDGVCICGAEEVTGPTLDTSLNFTTNSFSMGSALSMLYVFPKAGADKYADAYVVVEKDTAGGEPTQKIFRKAEFTSAISNYRIRFENIAARELCDNFRATIYATDANGKLYCGQTREISLKDYLLNMLNNPTTAAQVRMKPVLVDLLNYGAAAQVYFSYDVNNLANADLTDAQKLLGSQGAPTAVNNQSVGANTGFSCTYSNCAPAFGSKVTLMVTYNISKLLDRYEQLDVVVTNAATGEVLERSKLARIGTMTSAKASFSDLSMSEMRTLVNVAVFDGETQVSPMLTWSIESYVAQKVTGTNANLAAVCNALLNYGDAAADFAANK